MHGTVALICQSDTMFQQWGLLSAQQRETAVPLRMWRLLICYDSIQVPEAADGR